MWEESDREHDAYSVLVCIARSWKWREASSGPVRLRRFSACVQCSLLSPGRWPWDALRGACDGSSSAPTSVLCGACAWPAAPPICWFAAHAPVAALGVELVEQSFEASAIVHLPFSHWKHIRVIQYETTKQREICKGGWNSGGYLIIAVNDLVAYQIFLKYGRRLWAISYIWECENEV